MTTDKIETPEMAALRTARKAYLEVHHNAMKMHLGLALTPKIDRSAIIAALSTFDEFDREIVARYGELCLERDLGIRPGTT